MSVSLVIGRPVALCPSIAVAVVVEMEAMVDVVVVAVAVTAVIMDRGILVTR